MEKKQYVTPQTLMVCIEANEGILRISGGGTFIPVEGGTLTPGNAGILGASQLNINNVWGEEQNITLFKATPGQQIFSVGSTV